MKKFKTAEHRIIGYLELMHSVKCKQSQNLLFGAFKRATFLKLEVIMHQTMW